MRRLTILIFVFAVVVAVPMGKVALGEQQKITVTSDQQSIDYAKRIIVYQGNVRITWKDYRIEADEVEVFLTQKETLEKIVATDRVKINQGEKINGSCQKVTYFAHEDILVLEGEVEYQDNIGNNLQAQKVTIWAKEKKLQAEGKPVKAIYILKEEESVTTGGESK